MFLNVSFQRKEVFVDELRRLLIFVRLGIQPSTGSSSRCRAEIEQDGAELLLRCSQSLIDILAPIHAHHSPPFKSMLPQIEFVAILALRRRTGKDQAPEKSNGGSEWGSNPPVTG
jgi:hypothetical protein